MKLNYFIFLFIFFDSCYVGPRVREWDEIQESKELKIATINSSHTYFQSKDDVTEGFEYELVSNFAKKFNLTPVFIVADSIEEVIELVQKGEVDIGAAGITHTKKRDKTLSFTTAYFESEQSMACKQSYKINTLDDLKGLKIIIPQNTSYVDTLHKLKKTIKEFSWTEVEATSSESLLQEVWESEDLCTIVDSHLLNLHRRYIPELNITYHFKQKDQIAWSLNKQNSTLKKKLNQWFKLKTTKNYIGDLKRKYFDFIEFDPYNIKTFYKRMESRLPKYIDLFKAAAIKYELPWELLAAISYQESYWNPRAKSPTGVRGLMMLTMKTAKELNVTNRLDPKQSINGGAKYLKKLIERLPPYLKINDKIWFALASYNIGYYHLRDALALSIWQNEDPTKWHSVQKVLPLLSHKKYYKRLPYGHARGLEPVLYVKRIKNFYDILKKQFGPSATIRVYE